MSPLLVSLKTAIAATLLAGLFGVVLARIRLRSRSRIGGLIDALLLLPLALPPTVVGMILLLCFGRRSPIGIMLEKVGVAIVFSWSGAVIAAFVVAFPIVYQTARGAFRQLDPLLIDAAQLFSGSHLRILWRIMLPLAAPGITAGLLLAFVRALGEFGATFMVAGNIPGRTQTAPIAIFLAAETGEYSTAIALSAALLALSFAVIVLVNRLQRI